MELGSDVERDELFKRYHAVVYAVGTSADNRLGVDGEDRPGSHPATEFVAWYNGQPREFPTLGGGAEGGSDGVDGVAVGAHAVAVAGDGEHGGVVLSRVKILRTVVS